MIEPACLLAGGTKLIRSSNDLVPDFNELKNVTRESNGSECLHTDLVRWALIIPQFGSGACLARPCCATQALHRAKSVWRRYFVNDHGLPQLGSEHTHTNDYSDRASSRKNDLPGNERILRD